MANFVFNRGMDGITAGTIAWASDTIRCRLVASSASPTKDTTSMTGMTAIGSDVTLSNKTRTEDTTNDWIKFDNTVDPQFTTTAGSTIGWVIVYKFVTDDAGSTPIACLDVADTASVNGTMTVVFGANGIFTINQVDS